MTAQKKIIIAICCLVVLLTVAGVLAFLSASGTDRDVPDNTENTPVTSDNGESGNDAPGQQVGNANFPDNGDTENEAGQVIEEPRATDNASEPDPEAVAQARAKADEIINASRREAQTTPTPAMNAENREQAQAEWGEKISEKIDKNFKSSTSWTTPPDTEKAQSIARDFVTAFYNYDQSSMASKGYATSYSSLISTDALDYGNSELIAQHSDANWQATVATYPQLRSELLEIDVQPSTVSGYTHKDAILVPVSVLVKRNQNTPGEMDWDQLITYRLMLAVYLNAKYQVIDVQEQTSQIESID